MAVFTTKNVNVSNGTTDDRLEKLEQKLAAVKPEPHQMIAEYVMMFSGSLLKFYLSWVGLMALALLVFIYGPSTLTPSTNIVLRVIAFINAFFLFCGSGFLALEVALQLLARLILPLLISTLGVLRLLLLGFQFIIDGLLMRITQCSSYPTSEAGRQKTQ